MKKEIKRILNEIKDEDNYIEDLGFRYKRIAKNFIGDDKVSAKEMFEKLGYKFISENDEQIIYYNEGEIGLNKYEHKNTKPHLLYGTDKKIEFYKDIKSYQIFSQQLADDYEFCSMCVNMQELQAINKQIEELGWNNEDR